MKRNFRAFHHSGERIASEPGDSLGDKAARIIVAVLVALAAGLFSVSAAAAEPTPVTDRSNDLSAAVVNCNHYSGGGILPHSAKHVKIRFEGVIVGAIQLCRSGSVYWGYIVIYQPEPSGYWGQAYLSQYRNGTPLTTISCDTTPLGPPSGGNGYVAPGQTQCWTKKITGGASDTFQACGHEYAGVHPDRSIRVSEGCTANIH